MSDMKMYTVQLSMGITEHDMGHKARKAVKMIGKKRVSIIVSMTRAEMNRLDEQAQRDAMTEKAVKFVRLMETDDRRFGLDAGRYGTGRYTTSILEML